MTQTNFRVQRDYSYRLDLVRNDLNSSQRNQD